jgi:hypothetical protein
MARPLGPAAAGCAHEQRDQHAHLPTITVPPKHTHACVPSPPLYPPPPHPPPRHAPDTGIPPALPWPRSAPAVLAMVDKWVEEAGPDAPHRNRLADLRGQLAAELAQLKR